MKTVKLKITSHTQYFDETVEIYNKALSYLIEVVSQEWTSIFMLTAQQRLTNIEKLIHKTKNNPAPKYLNFDLFFYKFPSYFRRSTINEACGIVSSFKSNYQNGLIKKVEFESKGKVFKDKHPVLQLTHKAFPVFYKGNMFKRLDNNFATIKVFKDTDWNWTSIKFQDKNIKKRDLLNYKELNPSLVKNGKKYFLHIPFELQVKLKDVKIGLQDRIVIGVDLGLTNSAVCCAMKSDGTVIGRLFINQPVEKDRMKVAINRLSKAKSQSGIYGSKPHHWRRINGFQEFIVQDTVNQIVAFSLKHNAYAIVFEHLGKMKTPKGAKKLRFKLQYWAKQTIQNRTLFKAHSISIRVSKVNARNTSALAFDGSGLVKRNDKKDVATFASGKVYHADLSASYNIASRYFVREILKPLPETVRSQLEAKVSSIAQKTTVTLASLISLNQAI